MDTPSQESTGPLDLNQAGAALASIFSEPEKKEAEAATETDEDRAAKLITEESEAEAPKEEGEAEPEGAQKFTVKIDGKDVELTESEIADAYKNGLRQSDYTKKTMEAAETRKAAEAEKAQAAQERQEYAQKLSNYAIQLEGALAEQSKTNWQQLLETDPVEYLKQQHLYQQRQAAYQNAQQEQAKIYQQQQAEQAENLKTYLRTQQDELLAKLPEWKNEEKAKAEKEGIKKYLTDIGYKPEEVNSVADHRAVIMARKAMLYDNLMARAKDAAKKVAPLPAKVERPGVGELNPTDQRTAAQRRLAKSGSINDAAAVFTALLN